MIYVYQNIIDKRGHTRDTERKAFEATEEAMEEIVKLVRKLTSANATNVVITADHGFNQVWFCFLHLSELRNLLNCGNELGILVVR